MENLFEIQRVILEQVEAQSYYERTLFKQFRLDNQVTGIVGARGVGKTTFLLKTAIAQGALKKQALYVSADHSYFLDHTLIQLVDALYKQTEVRFLCIDEIHKHPHWRQQLKNISDIYFDFKILFSGSSQIDLIHGKYDLSRRVTLHHLRGFSFREYLEINFERQLPIFNFEDILNQHEQMIHDVHQAGILKQFHDYLKSGYYPFFIRFSDERDKYQAIENITQKIIYEDIAVFHSLKTPTLSLIERLYQFVLNSTPGEINASKLASTLKKDFESISQYLGYLEQAGLIRFLFPKKSGHAYLRNPEKMVPDNSNLLYAAYLPIPQDNLLGKARETFVINQLQNTENDVFSSDQGDFFVNDILLEIGRKNKNLKQVKHAKNGVVFADGILTGSHAKIPLYLLGFLY